MPSSRRLLLLAGLAAGLAACPSPESTECKGRVAGDLVVTEVMSNPPGDDKGKEYIELYNATSEPIALKGLVLYAAKVDGSSEKTAVLDTVLSVPPQSYFVAGDVAFNALAEWDDYGYGDSLGDLGGTSGLVGVRCGTTTLDEVKYEKLPSGEKDGAARQLSGDLVPDSAANDLLGNWCTSEQAGTGGVLGSPRKPNPPCGGGLGSTCNDPGTGVARALVRPTPGQVFITEVMANPLGNDSEREWFEVFSTADVDLNGLVISNLATSNSTLPKTDCLRVGANQYAVFAHDKAIDLPDVMGEFSFALTQAADGGTLALRTGDGGIIDEVHYFAPKKEGTAFQLDPTQLNAVANDDPANFCNATNSLKSDEGEEFGTPGAANTSCTAPPPPPPPPPPATSTCLDVSGATRSIVTPALGDLVITELLPNPKGNDAPYEWFEVLVKRAVDLNNLLFVRDTGTPGALTATNCLAVQANQYVVFSSSPEADGGVQPVLAKFPFAGNLGNTGVHTVSILLPDAGLLDTAQYDGGLDGRSWQLAQGSYDHQGNDTWSHFCSAQTADAGLGNLGTPGAVNEPCP